MLILQQVRGDTPGPPVPWIYLGSQYIPLGPDCHSAAEGWRWRGGGLRLFRAASIARVMPRRARSAEGQGPGHSLYRRPARMGRATPLALLGCRGRWNVPRSRCLSEKKRERFTRRGKSLPSRIWGSILKTRSEESPAAWGPHGGVARRPADPCQAGGLPRRQGGRCWSRPCAPRECAGTGGGSRRPGPQSHKAGANATVGVRVTGRNSRPMRSTGRQDRGPQ